MSSARGGASRSPAAPAEPVAPDLEPGQPGGIALSMAGHAAISLASEGSFRIHLVRPGEPSRLLYEHAEAAWGADMSLDGSLIAINHAEYGDFRHPALRVIRPNGDVVGELYDGPDKGVIGLKFAPVPGDRRRLALHERRQRQAPLVWERATD